MQSGLRDSWEPLLDALMASDEPMALHEVAEAAGVSLPTASRHLANMRDAGWVAVDGVRKAARYRPHEQVRVEWTARLGTRWHRFRWHAGSPVDWRFPLVSRVPSAAAREELLRFLPRVDDALLHRPDVVATRREPPGSGHPGPEPDTPLDEGQARAAWIHLTSPASYGPYIVGVFGSAARGDDRSTSDVDVFVVLPTLRTLPEDETVRRFVEHQAGEIRAQIAEELRDLAAGHGLTAARPIDLHVHNDPRRPVPTHLLQVVRREGITVHTTGPDDLLERSESWLHG